MDVHPSARRHGIGGADIRHAVNHPLVSYDISDEDGPMRSLVIGADRAANLLEIVVIERDDGSGIAIHAMPLRRGYRHLLPSPHQRDRP